MKPVIEEHKKREEQEKKKAESLRKHKEAIQKLKDKSDALVKYVQENCDLSRELRDCEGGKSCCSKINPSQYLKSSVKMIESPAYHA